MNAASPDVRGLPASQAGRAPVQSAGTRELLRQDPIRQIVWWLGVLLTGNMVLLLGQSNAVQRIATVSWLPYPPGYLFWVLVLWGSAVLYLLSPPSRTRCNDLIAGLPIPARRIWLLHTAAVLGSSLVLLAVATGMLTGGRWLLVRYLPPELVGPGLDVTTLATQVGAAIVLATVALQSLDLNQRKVFLRHGAGTRTLLILLGITVQVLVLSTLPLYLAALPVAAAILLGRRTYASLPGGFCLSPRQAVPAPAGQVESAEWIPSRPMGDASYCRRLLAFLWRENHKKMTIPYMLPMLGVPVLAALGLLLSGVLREAIGDDGLVMRLPAVPMVWYMLLAFIWPGIRNLYFVDSLPISRRHLFAFVALPPLAAILLGYGLGWGITLFAPGVPLVEYRELDAHHYVLVPDWVLQITRAEEQPVNVSPWGEAHQAAALLPLMEGGRTVLYSPFSTPEGSSVEFVAWQISRAVEAVYGHTIPPAEIQQRYLEVEAGGRVVPRSAGLTLLADYPGLTSRHRGPTFPAVLLLVSAPAFLLLSLFLRTMRASVSEGRQKAAMGIILGFCLALYMGTLLGSMLGPLNLEALSGLTEVLLRQAGETPGISALLWTSSLVLSALGYWWAQRQFLRIEVNQGRPGCSTFL